MPDSLLKFSSVAAGGTGHWHIYYGHTYVGVINPAGDRWRVWLHDLTLGEFDALAMAKQAVAEWYYGPGVT
ncbi:MAG TPA: hypothetical protein VHQ21_18540 [Rhodanobacteraceae bacterium]|jgi:hypothetical protein|nr:hypothetical protein [Rhodanobacteraceae bacterium]